MVALLDVFCVFILCLDLPSCIVSITELTESMISSRLLLRNGDRDRLHVLQVPYFLFISFEEGVSAVFYLDSVILVLEDTGSFHSIGVHLWNIDIWFPSFFISSDPHILWIFSSCRI